VTFAVTLPACAHVPDNTRLTATYSEENLLADVFREIRKLACLCQFSADSRFIFSRQRPQKRSFGQEPRVTFSQITGEIRWGEKKSKKTYRPYFFGLCYPNYTYFFIWPSDYSDVSERTQAGSFSLANAHKKL
jgi:hypothetical protein